MAINEAGAATGCLHGTFYASAQQQLQTVLELCAQVDDLFIARTAVYCRERGFMKDMPALLWRRCMAATW